MALSMGALVFEVAVGGFLFFFYGGDSHGIFYSVLMFLKVFLMVRIGILNLYSSDFIDGMCVLAMAPAMIIIRGSTCHPLAAILSINGLCLLFFASSVYGENLSLQYVNSMNCMVRLGSTSGGGVILVW